MEILHSIAITIVGLPLLGAIVAGLLGKSIGKNNTHIVTIVLLLISTILTWYLYYLFTLNQVNQIEIPLYLWGKSGGINFKIGFLLDELTILLMSIVTFISLIVHIYSIGYMYDDLGYQRFFSYISLFTFFMLVLVMSDNLLGLYFGWEGVGLASYLLIGFWFKKESATTAGLKAFLINRISDLGFLLGIASILYIFETLNYQIIFEQLTNTNPTAITIICACLFIGAMGKSAQLPLHIWLPDSMEGPTPISALIHAATMVTAGIFMVARLAPMFEYSSDILSFIMIIGTLTCFFMGILGIVQYDIKRIIAYSTLSQLGYMVTALGVSAYKISIFHLITHAFFKALLFLGAGSVIIAKHHEQDIRKMGALKKYMPITYITMLIGSLSLVGFPGFAGFYSKDLIIEAVHMSKLPYSDLVYLILVGSIFITSLYTFRMFFLVFHAKGTGTTVRHMHDHANIHESPKIITIPLIILAIPSIAIGYFFHDYIKNIKLIKGFMSFPFILILLGILTAWYCYIKNPRIPKLIIEKIPSLYKILISGYGFDLINNKIIIPWVRSISWLFWQVGDNGIIDGIAINGSANGIGILAKFFKKLQTGYLYHYVFVMITGFFALLVWLAWN